MGISSAILSEEELNQKVEEYDELVNSQSIKSYEWLLNTLMELKQLRAEKRYRERKIDLNLK